MNKILSIIIPIFNRGEKLKKCINSIPKEIDNLTEIIVVNDGSTENIAQVVLNLERNIKYIELNKNTGVSNARNIGIKNSTTKYITFIDSDDEFLHENFYKIVNILEDIDFDLLIANFETFPESSIQTYNLLKNSGLYKINNKELIRNFLLDPRGNSIMTYCWAKFYKKIFISNNNIKFNEELIINEDIEYISKILMKNSVIYLYPQKIYKYFINLNGLSNNVGTGEVLLSTINNYGDYIGDKELKKHALQISIIKQIVQLAKSKKFILLKSFIFKYNEYLINTNKSKISSKYLKYIFKFRFNKSKYVFYVSIKTLSMLGVLK